MSKYATFLALVCCIISQVVIADEDPAVGKLLVATEEVQGPTFAETVILADSLRRDRRHGACH